MYVRMERYLDVDQNQFLVYTYLVPSMACSEGECQWDHLSVYLVPLIFILLLFPTHLTYSQRITFKHRNSEKKNYNT